MARWKLGLRMLAAFVLASALCTFAACGGADFTPGVGTLIYDLNGPYTSTAPVGTYGTMGLILTQRNGGRVYEATLNFTNVLDIAESSGVGTLGGTHLLLNFERGLGTDYFFEGELKLNGDMVIGLEGTFIFPDESATLAAEFTRDF